MNVVFVSHCNFKGNSALHVLSIATELHRRGLAPAIAVPDSPETVGDIGEPPFAVLSYDEARSGGLAFPDGRGADLVHAFTPRELVRQLTVDLVRSNGCPYVVHLEDNEEAIVSVELGGPTFAELRRLPPPMLDSIIGQGQSHPVRAPRFVAGAAAVTVVVDRLLELKPPHTPGAVIRPGFDEIMLSPGKPRNEVRAELALDPDELAIVYTGSVHRTNLAEMRSLYLAVALLRRDGYPVVLVKTGLNWEPMPRRPELRDGLRDIGWVTRARVPELLGAADVLVQPGRPGPYSDYRYPSKLPDFLVSGRPVVLPKANLGLQLRDGEDALVLARGDAAEIYEKVALLAADPVLRERIGEQGRSFALRELRWSTGVDLLERLYRTALDGAARSPARAVSAERDPPVKLVAFVATAVGASDASLARAHGLYGFCLPPGPQGGPPPWASLAGLFFCFRFGRRTPADIDLSEVLAHPRYLWIGGLPLLVADDEASGREWRDRARESAGREVHLAVIEPCDQGAPESRGFDSLVEPVTPPRPGHGFDALMVERLRADLPDHVWFRSMPRPDDPPSNFPTSNFAAWLRKLVLQALVRGQAVPPLLFLDALGGPGEAFPPSKRWLADVKEGARDGVRQFYASQNVPLDVRTAEELLISPEPPGHP